MTMRTRHTVKCSCGHIGTIKMSENDQPYSKGWESYELVGLKGGPSFSVDGSATWEKVFQELSPSCPKCNAKLLPSDLVSP